MSSSESEDEVASVINDEVLLERALLASYVAYMEQPAEPSRETKIEQTPPASVDTLKCLPLLELRHEDLVDPVNRECCVCLDTHKAKDKAVRLPKCGHIFHQECIFDWLERKCTCPVCRFEYPTGDKGYEQKRLARQQESKPRYARHDLNQMPHPQLAGMIPVDDNKNNVGEDMLSKSELVNHLIKVGAVNVINIPEPAIEYSLSALRKMNIYQLRKLMNKEAAVFFDDRVTKKEEMIQVFVQSGRLCVLPEESAKVKAEKKRDASINKRSSRRLRTKIRRLFGPRVSTTSK